MAVQNGAVTLENSLVVPQLLPIELPYQQQFPFQVKNENTKHQQQVARSEEQNCVPKCEIARLKEILEGVTESDVAKVLSQIQNL